MSMEEQKKKVVKIVAIRGRDDIADLDEIIEKVDLKQICCISLDRKEYLSGIDVFEQADDFSSQLKLIANPIRLKILLILLNKEWACNCGLITFQKKGQWKFYKIPDEIRPFLEKVRDLIYILPKKCC